MIRTYAEIDLPSHVAVQVRDLLDEAFPAIFDGRTGFKQRPHRRSIAFDGWEVVGQVGLDFRAIGVADDVFDICALIDLCVRFDRRRRSVDSALIREAEIQARRSDLPFMLLMADRPDLDGQHGFLRVRPAVTTWLGIEDRRGIGLIERDLSDCVMAEPITARPWPEAPIDLLGYLF